MGLSWLVIVLLLHFFSTVLPCEVKVPTLTLTPKQYEGAWFVVARKPSTSRSFLPSNVTSSMIRLQIDGDDLHMVEYHTVGSQCMPALKGIWKPLPGGGYHMEVRTESGQLFTMPLRAIYHEYSGEQDEEMNMVVYGCLQPDYYGNCQLGEELVMIMSNSRHPQTLQLFKSAKLIEDSACIDILQFNILQTYTDCGNEIVDEDQKLIHAKMDENNEFVDVECKVANFKPASNNLSSFFDEPRILTVVAYIDPALNGEQIAHISCRYDSTEHAHCEWLRQGICLRSELFQRISPPELHISTKYTTLNGSEIDIDWSGVVVWENGDEYISMKCLAIDDDGGCDSFKIYVWSDEDHMDQPTIHEIYRQLEAICVDPTDLIFLNTFHECQEYNESAVEEACTQQSGWIPLSPAILQGVWYFAADLNAPSKILLQSAIVELTPTVENPWTMNLRYFAQHQDRGNCIGPGQGWAILTNDSELHVTFEYRYQLVKNHRNNMTFKYQVLYADNQRAVLYWCYKRLPDGTCGQHDVNFLIRYRHFSRNDLTMVLPYLEKVCIDKDMLRWFDLHSTCGSEMAASTKLRRDLVTLTHYDVLHILTNVQEPRCLYNQVKGVQTDLLALEKAGPWYVISLYDEMALDTYAMVARIFAVSPTSAVLRLLQSASLPDHPRECFTRVFTVRESHVDDDYYYELHYESTTKNSTTMIFRFLFYNKHVGVIYSCLANNPDGSCDEKAIYVLSRHESIDHAELIVLETISKAVCIDSNVLYHTAVHDDCVSDNSPLKPPACSTETETEAEWTTLQNDELAAFYGFSTYYAVASSKLIANPFAVKFNGSNFIKIFEQNGTCKHETVKIQFSARNRLLGLIEDEVVLFHPSGASVQVLLKEAQLSGRLPCLHPIQPQNINCPEMKPPECMSPGPLQIAEKLEGEWLLLASDPSYVLNERCQITSTDDGYHLFTCQSESWSGDCERESKYRMKIDGWGGFHLENDGEDAPLRIPSELMKHGNISVTDQRIVMLRDGELVGRRYSVWLKSGVSFTKEIEADVGRYCIWPLAPQFRSMEQICYKM